jgi:DNA gyrase/topoisomerase IV subunit B
VKYLVEGNTPRHPNIFSIAAEKDNIAVEVAFQYTQEMECTEESLQIIFIRLREVRIFQDSELL